MDHIDSDTTVPRFGWTRVFDRLVHWLVAKDAAYREAQHIQRLSPHMRRDIGLPPYDVRTELSRIKAPW
ncbi:MAG: hypothetical protein AAGE38_10160 [Pseudomonadota bacterium]